MPIDVLIAEDSRIQARMLQKRLADAGYAVRSADNHSALPAVMRNRNKERPGRCQTSEFVRPQIEKCEQKTIPFDWVSLPVIHCRTA